MKLLVLKTYSQEHNVLVQVGFKSPVEEGVKYVLQIVELWSDFP